jgi:hypothetical protein
LFSHGWLAQIRNLFLVLIVAVVADKRALPAPEMAALKWLVWAMMKSVEMPP